MNTCETNPFIDGDYCQTHDYFNCPYTAADELAASTWESPYDAETRIAFDRYAADAQYRADAWHRGTMAQLAVHGGRVLRKAGRSARLSSMATCSYDRRAVESAAWHTAESAGTRYQYS